VANHKSAAKRARQSIRKTATNTSRKNAVRTFEKKLTKALESKAVSELPALLKNFASQIMKAAKAGVFKKETAARKISRLSKKVSATTAPKK